MKNLYKSRLATQIELTLTRLELAETAEQERQELFKFLKEILEITFN